MPETNQQVPIPTQNGARTVRLIKTKAKQHGIKILKERWHQKPLHGQYPLRTLDADVDQIKTHQWLRSSGGKAETEGFILAPQDQSLLTRNYQAHVIKNGFSPNSRFYDCSPDTIDHIISGCSVLAPKGYKLRHDRVGQYIHWIICKHYGVSHTRHWYEHHPEPVTETQNTTNRTIVMKYKKRKEHLLIDMTIPSDKNTSLKEFEELSKYKDLEIEVTKL